MGDMELLPNINLFCEISSTAEDMRPNYLSVIETLAISVVLSRMLLLYAVEYCIPLYLFYIVLSFIGLLGIADHPDEYLCSKEQNMPSRVTELQFCDGINDCVGDIDEPSHCQTGESM